MRRVPAVQINVNEMTFGIEIETYIPGPAFYGARWSRGGYHSGNPIPGFTGWRADSDGSLMQPPRGMADAVAVEVVSPVLRGPEGMADVKRMVAKLNEMGARVNATTGFHVHVGFDATNVAALMRLVHLVSHVEDALQASTGTLMRRDYLYCQSVKRDYVPLKDKHAANLRSIQRLCSAVSDRRHVLNISNLLGSRKPTVEFRVFAGTVNFAKIAGYIQLCLGLVQKAIEDKRRVNWDAKDVSDRSSIHRGGRGATDLYRLFNLLGWQSQFHAPERGVVAPETVRPAMEVLMRMARQFDQRLAAATTPAAPDVPTEDPPAVPPARFAGGHDDRADLTWAARQLVDHLSGVRPTADPAVVNSVLCEQCHGTGASGMAVPTDQFCPRCNGFGVIGVSSQRLTAAAQAVVDHVSGVHPSDDPAVMHGVVCEACHGTGEIANTVRPSGGCYTCSMCNGRGVLGE